MNEVIYIDRQRAKMPVTMQSTEIIAYLPRVAGPLFMLTGFRHIELMLKLGVGFAVLKTLESVRRIPPKARDELHGAFSGHDVYFVLHNNPHAVDEVRGYRKELGAMLPQLYLIDIEVLKAHELLITGLPMEDVTIGLELPRNATLSYYVKEIRKEQRHSGGDVYTYAAKHLLREAERLKTNYAKQGE